VVTSLANDCVFGHGLEVLGSDDIAATSRGDEDIGTGSSLFHGRDLVPRHRSLESVDRVDLGDNNACTVRAERFGTLVMNRVRQQPTLESTNDTDPLANITEASNNGDLTSKHDVGGTLDSVDERLAAAVVLITGSIVNNASRVGVTS
jgi:hypothetical protein